MDIYYLIAGVYFAGIVTGIGINKYMAWREYRHWDIEPLPAFLKRQAD